MADAPMKAQRGQVLAFFAIVLPLVLIPILAYAIDASVVSARFAALQALTAQAAERAAEQIDVGVLRTTGALVLDPARARLVVQEMLSRDGAGAIVDSIGFRASTVSVATSEKVELPLAVVARTLTIHVRASARLVAGYDSASSFLPFSTSTF